MPTAMGRALHIDTPLTNLAISNFARTSNYVADAVFPVVQVGKQSDKYYTFNQSDFLRVPRTYRAPKTLANRVEFTVSSDAYYCNEYALADANALSDLENADAAIGLRQASVDIITNGLMIDREARVVTAVNANVASLNRIATAGATWDAVTSADIITPVRDAKQYIFKTTGLVPNAVVIDWMSYDYATRNERAWSKLQYTQADGQLTLQHLKQLWDVENVYIANGRKENAREGGTSSYTSIWGATCFVYYKPPVAATLKTAAYGLSMRWTPARYPAPFTVARQSFSGPGTRNEEVIEAGYFQAEKVTGSALGFLINTKSGTPW